ncbi:hypothetical protein [Citricoccus sp. GCM10030269]|uniref:hypothetical protein n=1 Tax=Citricoccus sp. GCM10030269 TaxID=3273388 RepID=UPI00361318DD
MTEWTPQPTGDPAADAILESLQGADELSPEREIEVYRTALEALARLLDEPPQQPGPPQPGPPQQPGSS